jgi:hypothetical protein
MSLPQTEQNAVCTVVRPIADLGLASTVTSAANVTSTPFTTGCPATVIVISKLTSGSGTLTIDRAASAGAINHGAPDNTLSVSGTAHQVSVLDTSSSELFVGLRQSSAGSAVWDDLVVLVLYALTDGEEWFAVRSSANAVMNDTVGDGSGVLDMSIA